MDLLRLKEKQNWTAGDITELLSLTGEEEREVLRRAADEVLRREVGPAVYYRGIVEFSNICALDCLYCGIRRGNGGVDRYSLEDEQILSSVKWCAENGYGSVVLQSGERRDREFIRHVERLLIRIKEETRSEKLPRGVGITLSVGEQTEETYRRWFQAGAHRYLLRMETSDPDLFRRIHPPEQSLEARLRALGALRKAGYQVGTGVMIGLPGQTPAMLARDILTFRDLDVDMIGMGPYIVSHGSPLAEQGMMEKQALLKLAFNMIAVTRLVLRDVNIAATTALQALTSDGRERGLTYGANVTMPNLTPRGVRKSYQLYEGKPCVEEDKEECRGCLLGRIRSVDRDVAFDAWGDSVHFARRQSGEAAREQ